MKKLTYTISEAQSNLPKLCQSGRRFVVSRRDKPVYIAMPLEDYKWGLNPSGEKGESVR